MKASFAVKILRWHFLHDSPFSFRLPPSLLQYDYVPLLFSFTSNYHSPSLPLFLLQDCRRDPTSSATHSGPITLEQCLELFTEPETLSKEEAWWGHIPKLDWEWDWSIQLQSFPFLPLLHAVGQSACKWGNRLSAWNCVLSTILALFPGHAHTDTPFYVPSLCITEMLNMSSTLYIASMCSPLWNPMADCHRLSKMCLKTLPQMVVEAHLGSHPDWLHAPLLHTKWCIGSVPGWLPSPSLLSLTLIGAVKLLAPSFIACLHYVSDHDCNYWISLTLVLC